MLINDILALISVMSVCEKIGVFKKYKTHAIIPITSDVPERFKITSYQKKKLTKIAEGSSTRMTIEDFKNWIEDHCGYWTDESGRYANIEQIFGDMSSSIMKRPVPNGIKILPYVSDKWLEPTLENAAIDPLYIKR